MTSQAVKRLSEAMERTSIDAAGVARILNRDPKTVSRWLREETIPRWDAREQLLALDVVLERLADVVPPDAAQEWLFTPVPALDYHRPVDLVRTGSTGGCSRSSTPWVRGSSHRRRSGPSVHRGARSARMEQLHGSGLPSPRPGLRTPQRRGGTPLRWSLEPAGQLLGDLHRVSGRDGGCRVPTPAGIGEPARGPTPRARHHPPRSGPGARPAIGRSTECVGHRTRGHPWGGPVRPPRHRGSCAVPGLCGHRGPIGHRRW